ncbi:MAG: hypothetical protein LAO79_26090 [Acidobacteriia bacterium]|nr:hypothetical protein [Terriglobia bacterium]
MKLSGSFALSRLGRGGTFSRLLTLLAVPAICLGQPGIISTVVGSGSGTYSGDGGPALKAGLPSPTGLAMDSAGNLYILETGIARVRKVSTNGTITAYAGNGTSGFSGDGGAATSAQFFPGHGIAVDSSGNLYIADLYNNRIRKVDPSGIITTFAGSGTANSIGQGGYSGDGGPATAAMLNLPDGVAVDAAGNVYIADSSNYRIRRVDKNTGVITTVAGNGNVPQNKQTANDGGVATQVPIQQPSSVTVDSAGNFYFSDGARVQKVDTSGVIRTVAGTGTLGDTGDGGPGTSAEVKSVSALAADNAGNLYISESTNRVRRVDASGIITTVAGNGTRGSTGDGGPAISAQLTNPQGVVVDSAGNFYIAESNVIRKVNAPVASTTPTISLVSNAFGGSQTIAPNTWIQVKGVNLAPAGDTRIWAASDFVNNQLPTQLDGVSVTVNGKSAFVFFISPTQLNILTPPDAISGTVAVQVTNGGVKSNVVNNAAQPLSLAFFTFDATHITATHLDGSLVGPTTLYPGLSTPAKPGETIIVYANGFGTTTVPIVSGGLTQSGTLTGLLVVGIGGYPANVPFSGLVAPGEFQFNIVVPPSAPDGDLGISASYDGAFTPSSATLAVQH